MIARSARQLPLVFALALVLALVPVALAAKGGGKPSGGGGAGGGGYTGTISTPVMVFDANHDGLPNWNDQITFNVTSTAQFPLVQVNCYQNGVNVDGQIIGFYVGWAWSKNFPLATWMWTGGAASCTAKLYYQSSKSGDVTLATTSFSVGA